MNNLNKQLIREQLNKKVEKMAVLKEFDTPPKGWIFSIRKSLNMTLGQFAKKLGITSPSAQNLELREENKSITLKKLSEAAEALNCRLVYAIIPKEGSLDDIIEKRALKIAEEIVLRTSHTMMLEDQENSRERLQNAIRDRADKIKYEMPKYLWD